MKRSAMRVLMLSLLVLAPGRCFAVTLDPCEPETVRVDTSRFQGTITFILGESGGETFRAPRDQIRSLSVWRRWYPPTTYAAVKLWITRMAWYGPDLTSEGVLLNGPTLYTSPTEGDSLLRERWVFDPPFQLPGPGEYAFFVQDPCAYPFDLWVNKTDNVYPDGHLVLTSRTNLAGCWLRAPYSQFYEMYDLLFEIEFCGQDRTPVKQPTWGHLKIIYR